MFNTNTSNNLIFIIKSHLIIQSFCLHPVRKIRIFCRYCTSGGRDFRREAYGIPGPADKGKPTICGVPGIVCTWKRQFLRTTTAWNCTLSLKMAVFKDKVLKNQLISSILKGSGCIAYHFFSPFCLISESVQGDIMSWISSHFLDTMWSPGEEQNR